MSKKIAQASLDFVGTGSVCGDNKGVTAMDPQLAETTIKMYLMKFVTGSIRPRE